MEFIVFSQGTPRKTLEAQFINQATRPAAPCFAIWFGTDSCTYQPKYFREEMLFFFINQLFKEGNFPQAYNLPKIIHITSVTEIYLIEVYLAAMA